MHHEVRRECSNCESTTYESFQQKNKRGIRCLRCGHEKLSIPEPATPTTLRYESLVSTTDGKFNAQ